MTIREEIARAMFAEFWSRQGGRRFSPTEIERLWRELHRGSRRGWFLRTDAVLGVLASRCRDAAALGEILNAEAPQ